MGDDCLACCTFVMFVFVCLYSGVSSRDREKTLLCCIPTAKAQISRHISTFVIRSQECMISKLDKCSLCSSEGSFGHNFVANAKDRFSRDVSHMVMLKVIDKRYGESVSMNAV